MVTVRGLLARGNGKLGGAIHHFDLPAVATCPGRSAACERVCYASRGRFRTAQVRERLAWSLRQSRRADFADRMVAEVRGKGAVVVRVHVAGDFYDAGYAGKWLAVFARCPAARFYFYTRSWRVPEVRAVLERAAGRDNVRAWYSADADTGPPAAVPAGVRVAWLQAAAADAPAGDLVFRDRPLRTIPARVGLPVVCPAETPRGRARGANCGNCGHCWK